MTQLSAIFPQFRRYQRVRVRPGVHIFGGMAGVVVRSIVHPDGTTTYDVALGDKAYMHKCDADAVAFEEYELHQTDLEEVVR